jgi:hypothetical protein
MKKIVLLIMANSCFGLLSFSQTWQWTHPEPNGSSDVTDNSDAAHHIETDASGNVYVLGDFKDSLFLNNVYRTKGDGSYLAKYDSTGALLWYKLIIRTSDSSTTIKATDIAVTAQGVFVIGKYDKSFLDRSKNNIIDYSYTIGSYNFTSNIDDAGVFLTKFNSNGGVVWNDLVRLQRPLDTDYYNGNAFFMNPLITSDKNNNIICEFGYIGPKWNLSIGSNTIPAFVSNYSILVFKMNNGGTLLWSKHAENLTFIYGFPPTLCNSIVTDKNGNIFLYGRASDYTAFDSITYHTNYFLKDSTVTFSTFIAKLSSSGVWQFVKELINTNLDGYIIGNPEFLAVDNSNNLYALVNTNLSTGFPYGVIMGDTVAVITDQARTFLVKLNNSGNLIWHKGYEGDEGNGQYANSIQFANNALYVCGGFGTTPYYNLFLFPNLFVPSPGCPAGCSRVYYVAKANANGDFQWVTNIVGPTGGWLQNGFAVKVFNDNIYTAGYYSTAVTSLGNLNGTYTTKDTYVSNTFFGKLKDQYIRVGAVTPTSLIPGCTISIPFTSFGLNLSTANTFTAELSDIYGDFTNATAIGNTTSSGSGTITATIPASLTYGSGYRVRIYSSDTLKTGYKYYAYADAPYVLSLVCPAPSSGFAATNITATSATLNWTVAGCASGYKVQYRVKGTTAWTTVNITANTATVNITGLTVNTIYQWRVATKCKNNGTNSFSPFSVIKQFTTAAAFVSTSNNMSEVSGLNKLDIFVQPNPAATNATLIINGKVKNASVFITDLIGKTIWQTEAINNNQVLLPIQNLAAGIYFIKLVNGNETRIAKLVKE